jgi:hypothetical protein
VVHPTSGYTQTALLSASAGNYFWLTNAYIFSIYFPFLKKIVGL